MKKRDEIIALIKEVLPEKRFKHTLSVEKEALYLASLLGLENSEEISCASLLHDITKPLTFEEHKEIIKKLSEDDLKSPEVLHALSGSIKAKEMGFNKNISSMIESHTTAKPDMTVFEEIIFVADYTEETRTYENCIKERERLHRELLENESEKRKEILKKSVKRILESTVEYLNKKNSFIHPRTLLALDFLLEHKED